MANKEHVFTIALSFDEDSIREKAEEYVISELDKNVRSIYLDKTPYFSGKPRASSDLKDIVDVVVERFLKENREEIIDIAAKKISESVRRSKAFKEKLEEVNE